MKTIQVLGISLLLLFSISCQKEENVIIQNTNENLAKDAPLLNLLSRVVQNPTSLDNVLDNSSCFRVQLPVAVIVNGQQITVNTSSDYQIVQNAMDAFANDDDIVNFIFPITLHFQNFQSLIVNNSNHLNAVLNNCDEDDDFHELDCITINYPVVINTFDTNSQTANTIPFTNNIDLYNFIENLNYTITLSIIYPLSLTNSNNQTININSNNELQDAIETVIEDCGGNSGGGNPGNATLQSVIINGTWHVSYFFTNNIVQTNDFNGYTFTFNTNNSIGVIGNGNTINGTWEITSNGNEKKIEFEFDGNILERLSEKWKVVEYTNTVIRLRLVGGGNGGNNYAYFTKN